MAAAVPAMLAVMRAPDFVVPPDDPSELPGVIELQLLLIAALEARGLGDRDGGTLGASLRGAREILRDGSERVIGGSRRALAPAGRRGVAPARALASRSGGVLSAGRPAGPPIG